MTSSLILLIVMVVLILLNAPITYALAMAGIVFFLQHGLSGIQYIVKLAGGIDIFTLLAAPLFIFCRQHHEPRRCDRPHL